MTDRCPFLDEDSATDLQWEALWRDFAPVTPFGLRAKAALTPYVPGAEVAWQRSLEQLRADEALCGPDCTRAMADALQSIPDTADALSALADPGASLTIRQLLALKQFLFYGSRLAGGGAAAPPESPPPARPPSTVAAPSESPPPARPPSTVAVPSEPPPPLPLFAWTTPGLWRELLADFGDPATPSFAVDHVADDAWREAARAFAECSRVVAVAVRQRDREWLDACGVHPTRDGQLVLRLPEQRAVADRLKREKRALWVRETPFEVVFDLPEAKELSDGRTERAAAAAALEAEEDRVLGAFAGKLRRRLPAFRQLAADVGALDLRLAKLRLLREWDGCVPQPGDAVRIAGGVHPLVARRLHNRAYVPLDFAPEPGANVLCGANMGGKTVALSLLCLCQTLAQYGLPVPARSFRTRLFRFVRFCAGAATDLDNGLSAYGREVTKLREVWSLWRDLGDGLVCLDEPARSTNPVEGEALVVALLRQIGMRPRRGLWVVATHLAGAIAEPGPAKFRVRGLAGRLPPDAVEDRLALLADAMDYRVEPMTGGAPPAEALQVAEWLGLAQEIVEESRRYLGESGRQNLGEGNP